MKKSEGFTLIELLVGILCATLITGAAMSLLLMGARTNRSLLDANTEQQTARVLTSLVESLASEGSIKTVVTVGKDEAGKNDWALLDVDGSTILNYSYSDRTIYSQNDASLMENITTSSVSLSDPDNTITGRLLNFSMTTTDDTYTTSVFCRTADMGDKTIDGDKLEEENSDTDIEGDISINMSASEETGRFKFLEVLCTQYGSTGEIKPDTDSYFSEWYLKKVFNYDSYEDYYQNTGYYWNKDTPWCGCFLSWGIDKVSHHLNGAAIPCFANVSDGAYLFNSEYNGEYGTWHNRGAYTPSAGDLIFFSWDSSENLHHVGAVFYADSQYVITIEGNNSGRVELNRYLLSDPEIVGYGVLNWK